MADKYAQFARDCFRYRDRIRGELGDGYLEVLQPLMDTLRGVARLTGVSVVKAFERSVTPAVRDQDQLSIALWSAALAELYELREKALPGIGRG